MKRSRVLRRFTAKQARWVLWTVILLTCCFVSDVPGASQRLSYDLLSASFPNDQSGWVCGRWGTILHTEDGGKTWVPQKSDTDFTLVSIHFVDSSTGWAVGDSGTILHTKDGGKTWIKQKSPVPYFLTGVQFVSSRNGWIVTERTTILYTQDGGENWQVQFKDEDFILKRVSFCDERPGWAVGEFGFIYHTGDGGKSWRKQAGEFRFSKETGEMVGGNFLFDVFAVNPRSAWAVGIDSYVIKTLDGGRSWQKVADGIPRSHLFSVIYKEGRLLIGGDALLLTSSDEGRTLRNVKIEPQITYGWIYAITPRGGSGFVAVGKGGWIYLSDKEGTTWRLADKQ